MNAMQDIIKKRLYPRNPLGIIALFVFFIEAISTFSLKLMLEGNSEYVRHIVWFIILFPFTIALLFFATLWWKRESFYGPQDFQDEKHFVGLLDKMNQRVEDLQIRQEATQIDAGADIHEFAQTTEKLSGKGDIHTAIRVGRIPLKEGRYDSSYEVFKYLEEHVPQSDKLYTRILANLAYSLIGLNKFGEAIDKLKEVHRLRDEKNFYAWHAVALAYSYFKLNEDKEYRKWLSYAKKRGEYSRNLFLMERLYPEITKDL